MSESQFKCPRCGCSEWGSSYNFDGPGDTPITRPNELDTGGRSSRYEGTFTRMCHGYVDNGSRSCAFTWNSRDDAKYGIKNDLGSSVGTSR